MVRNYKRKTEDKWTKEDLLEALTLIREGKVKINDAARQFGISRATLYRQFQKFVDCGGKCDLNQFKTCGGNPILTRVEEDVLEKTIIDLRDQGFTVNSIDIKRICFEYCASNSIPNQFNQDRRMASDDWYYGYLKRHPEVRNGGRLNASITGAELIDLDQDDIKPVRRKSKSGSYRPRRKILKVKRSGKNSGKMMIARGIQIEIKQEKEEYMEMEDTSPLNEGSMEEETAEAMMIGDQDNNAATETNETDPGSDPDWKIGQNNVKKEKV